jgi:autonomous glycyl radical cofactor GrcA
VLDHIKSGKDYAILQAENPNNERISDAENAKRNREMVSELRKAGYEPVPVEGNTKDVEGQKEHAFFVPDITPEDAVKFGKKYNQAAILTTEGLHDLKTNKVNPANTKSLMLGDEARKQPYFTNVGGQDFSVPVDFSKVVDKGKIKAFHYSNENNLTELDPEKFNANSISPEAKRAKQFPEQAVKQTFLGTDKYQEKPIQGRANKYAAELDPSKYYDLEKDPDGLIQEAGKLAAEKGHYGDAAVSSYLDKLVKDKGYAGHIDQSGVVRSFEKVPVTKVPPKAVSSNAKTE